MDEEGIARMAKIAGHIGGTVQVQSSKAVEVIHGMLKAENLDWAGVLVAGIRSIQAAGRKVEGPGPIGFEDIFADMMSSFGMQPETSGSTPQPAPAEPRPAAARPKKIMQAGDVPPIVMGCVRINDQSSFRGGTKLTVTLITDHEIIGPLTVFDQDDVALIRSLDPGTTIGGRTRPSTNPIHPPTLRKVSILQDA